MARIPTDNLPQINPIGMPDVRMSPQAPEGAFGGGQDAANAYGQARGLAQDIARQQEEVRQKADLAAVFKATAELSNYVTDTQYNPQTGIVAQKGENAFPLAKSVPEGYRRKASDLMNTLSSPEQRDAFQRQVDSHWGELNRFNQNHIAGQSDQFMAQQADAYVAARQNAGALAGSTLDFAGIAKAAEDVDQARRVWALKNGVSQDVANLIIQKDTSRVYAGAITSMVDAQQDLAAKKYFLENKDKLTAQDLEHVSKLIENGSILGEAYRLSDVVMSYEPDSLKAAQDHFEKIAGDADPKVRQEAERLMAQKFAVQQAARQEAYKSDVQTASNIIESFATSDPRKATILAIPSDVRERLTRTDLTALQKRAKAIVSGEDQATNPETYYELSRLSENPDTRKQFLARNLLTDFNKGDLSKADFDKFADLQSKKYGEAPKSMETLSFHDRVKDALLKNKVFEDIGDKLSPEEKRRWGAFELAADQQIKILEAREKRPAKPEEAQQIIDDLIKRQVEVSAVWSNKMTPVGALLPEETISLPEARRNEMAAELKAAGKSVSGDKLVRMWQAAQLGNREAYVRIFNEK